MSNFKVNLQLSPDQIAYILVRYNREHGAWPKPMNGINAAIKDYLGKNGAPTLQWELLRQFAAGHGVLTWRSAGADRKNKKRRENLARHLERFFRIEGDPFIRQGNGWRAQFQIESDR